MLNKLLRVWCILLALSITTCWGASKKCLEKDEWNKLHIRLIAALAGARRVEEAQTELKKLKNYEQFIPAVVTELYNKDVKNSAHIYQLLSNLSCSAYESGTEAWFRQLEENDNLSALEILILSKSLEETECTQSVKVVETKDLVASYVEWIVKWVTGIRNGKFANIFTFAKTGPVHHVSVLAQIPTIVKTQLAGNVSNFPAVLEFVKSTPDVQQMGAGFFALITYLTILGKSHSSEMLQLAFWARESMKNPTETTSSSKEVQEVVNRLKTGIPKEIRSIFWNVKEECAIDSLAKWEELDAEATYDRMEGVNGVVFTQLSGAGRWALKPELLEGKVVFKLGVKSVSISAAEDDKYILCQDKNTARVVTCSDVVPHPDLLTQWLITPILWKSVDKEEKAFVLDNAEDEKAGYLMATGDYHEAGRRMLKVVEGEPQPWRINCV